jgi:hypothetical protein
MKTIFDFNPSEIILSDYEYKYQPELTNKLDDFSGDIDQNVINEIVLWKVNRYAAIDYETINLLNKINKSDIEINIEIVGAIFLRLLHEDQKGVRLAMASTFLRFRNPKLYQIIDQRVYRFIYGKELKYDLKNINEQIVIYTDYLKKLKEICNKYNVEFEDSDRVFYSMDKLYNKQIKLRW